MLSGAAVLQVRLPAVILVFAHAFQAASAHAATRASSRIAYAHAKLHRTAHYEHVKLHPARHATPHTHAEPTRTRMPIRCASHA
eukprot:2886442-Pleurochrysis_carterae.AAC.2